MLPDILPDVHLIFGVYPIAPLIVAAAVWLLYRVLLFQKCRPKHGIVFLMAGATLAFLSFFCELARPLLFVRCNMVNNEPEWIFYERLYTISITSDMAFRLQEAYLRLTEWTGIQPIYLSIIAVLLAVIGVQLFRILRIHQQAHLRSEDKEVRIYQTRLSSPFSFGKSVFLPEQLDEQRQSYVLSHEMSHVRHHHLNALLFVQLMLCTQWYNPFFWILLYEIKLSQEFEADRDALSSHPDRQNYQLCLVEMATNHRDLLSVKHHFANYSLKQRIISMNNPTFFNASRKRLFIVLSAVLAIVLIIVSHQPDILTRQMEAADIPQHPLYGTWKRINATVKADTLQNMQFDAHYYKIIHNNRALLLELLQYNPNTKDIQLHGRTISFQYVCDTLIQENGETYRIERVDDDHFSLTWYQEYVSPTNEITQHRTIIELWERTELPQPLKEIWDTELQKKVLPTDRKSK